MKLNKNGWGTLEMFLLSGGLLLALIVAIFFISKLYGSLPNTVANKVYFDLETEIESAAKEYVNEYNISIEGEYKISLSTLKSNGNITDFADSDGNSCNGYALVYEIDNINHYDGYILCNEYQTENY